MVQACNTFTKFMAVAALVTALKADEESECELNNNPEEARPKVTPYNKSHVNVIWDKVFQGCRQEEIADLNVFSGKLIAPVKLEQ